MDTLILYSRQKNNSGKRRAKKKNIDDAEKATTGVSIDNKDVEVGAEAEADQVRMKIHIVNSCFIINFIMFTTL